MSVSGNLTNNGALTTTNSTVIANGTTPQILTNASYRNLTANNSAGVSLGSSATVSHLLTLNSDLLTGVFVLTMPWVTEASAGAGDVVGNIRVTGLNAGPASYGNPFNTIAFASGTPPADITVNLAKATPIGFPSAVQRTYTITPNGGAGFAATVRLHYLDTELNGNTEGAALSLWRFNGSSWEKKVTCAFSTTNNWVETTNVTQFSPWTFNSSAPTAARVTISGQITSDVGAPLGGVLLSLTGGNTQRHTITSSDGLYQFTELEAGAFYSIRPMRANYGFAPSELSFSLLGNRTDAVFTAHAESESANPLDTPEFFVRQQYLDFLSREPDADGFNYWVAAISQCGAEASCQRAKRIDVANAFFYAQEFQESAAYVYRIYKAALGQPPTFAQFQPDRELLVGGTDLDQKKLAFALAFAQRDPFVSVYPRSQTREQFVDAIVNTINSSGLDLAFRRAELLALFDGTDKGRAAILRQLADDQSFIASEYNRSFVLTQYFGYLRRDPDQGGFDFWLGQVNSAPLRDITKQHAMVCSFISSTEYQRRFSSIVTHSNAGCR